MALLELYDAILFEELILFFLDFVKSDTIWVIDIIWVLASIQEKTLLNLERDSMLHVCNTTMQPKDRDNTLKMEIRHFPHSGTTRPKSRYSH